MKNQYVGDENDFRKNGLLRALTGPRTGLALGVNWVLTPDDGSADGKFVRYLSQPLRWRHFDSELFDALGELLAHGDGSVARVEESGILRNVRFYSAVVGHRRSERAQHIEAALETLSGADVLLFDPDKGIEISSCAIGRKNSERHVAWAELTTAYQYGHSVLLYQHWWREPRDAFGTRMVAGLHSRLGARVVHAFATPRVLFLLAPQPAHERVLAFAAAAVEQQWEGQIGHSEHWLARP